MSTRNRRSEEKEKYERGERKATIHSPILRFLSSFLSKIMIVKKKKNEAFAKAAVISSGTVGNPCATITDIPSMHSTYLSDANLETLGLSDNFPAFNHGELRRIINIGLSGSVRGLGIGSALKLVSFAFL